MSSVYYSVLKKKIIERDLRSPAQREEVYAQARAAVVNRLWSYDPPLSEDEIDARIGAFDATVERIEADLVTIFADAPEGEPERGSEPARRPALAALEGYDEEADYAPGPSHGIRPANSPEDDDLDEIWRTGGLDLPALRRAAPVVTTTRSRETVRAAERAAPAWIDEDEGSEPGDYAGSDFDVSGTTGRAGPTPAQDKMRGRLDHARLSMAHATLRLREAFAQWRWRDLDDRGRTQLLIAAIAALSIILVAIAAIALLPLLFGPQDGTATAPPASAPRQVVSDPATAERIPQESVEVRQSFVIFDGDDPTVFEASPDNPVRFDSDSSVGFARVSSSSVAAGVRVNIGPGLAARLAGQNIRVTIVARSARENGATNFRFAYQSGVALSHWQVANLKADYMPFGLIWRVPAMRTDPEGDYILIEPGIPGDGTAVEIQSIKVDVIGQ